MASRIQHVTVKPWAGGLNVGDDAANIQPDEVTVGNNVVFKTNNSRKSRGALLYWDYVGISVERSSSGTTRTIQFTLNAGVTIAVNDEISIRNSSSSSADYDNKRVTVTSVTLVSGTTYDIDYEMTEPLTEAITADTDFRIGLFNDTKKTIGVKDYWYLSGGVKTQKRLAVMSDGTFYEYDANGSRTALTSTLSLTTPVNNCDFAVLGNKLVISFSGTGNKPAIYSGSGSVDPVTNLDYEGNDVSSTNAVPDIENMRRVGSRIFATDKVSVDRVHYCDIEEPERWNGEGDSGALEFPLGDGDSSGVTAIFPSLNTIVGVAKRNSLHKVVGHLPLVAVQDVSDGVGSVSHHSVVSVDQNDILFASKKGFHSFVNTEKFGNVEGGFLSRKIGPMYEDLDGTNLNLLKGVYFPKISSVVWIAREGGQNFNTKAILYDVEGLRWYTWTAEETEFKLESISIIEESGIDELYIGTSDGRILKYDEDGDKDFVADTIKYEVKTGIVYPAGDTGDIVGFKGVGLTFKTDKADVTFDVEFKVDNFVEQKKTVTGNVDGDRLGTTFILGTSVLGAKEVLLPTYVDFNGYGYGCSVKVTSSTPIEVYKYSVYYEPAGDQQKAIRE